VNLEGFGAEAKPAAAKAELAFIDQLDAREIAEGVAGLARLRLSEEQPMELYLFRKEKTLVFNWAGNPQKPVEVAEGEGFARLSPRKSFELWQEQVRGYSLPWTYLDKDFVNRLKEVLSLQFYGEKQVSASGKHAIKLIQHERDQLNRRIFILEEKLTDLEKAHQDGLIMLKDAKKLTMAKSDLVGNLSHEMRTPLNGILGFAQLLLKEDSDKAKRYGQLILDCGQRMLDTFENLMRYSRIEHESLEAHSESGNLEDLVQAVIQSLEGEAFAKDQELSVVIHNKKAVFLADRLLIGQILKNLIGNAIKFTPASGKVEVNAKVLTEKDQHYLNLSVEDNGEGIPVDKHGQVFDPFYTVHKQERMKDNSSGLGLYLVKSYVDFLHGYIHLESKVGTGSRFSVILPIQLKEDV
jgi:signal transduction histidine kinase